MKVTDQELCGCDLIGSIRCQERIVLSGQRSDRKDRVEKDGEKSKERNKDKD